MPRRPPAEPGPTGTAPGWGLGEPAVAFVVGVVLATIFASVAQAAVDFHPGNGRPIPLAVNAASLVGLWLGLGGGAVYCSRRRGTGSLARDFGLWLRWPLDVGVGLVVGLASQLLLGSVLYWPFEQAFPSLRHQIEKPAQQDIKGVHGAAAVTLLFVLLVIGAPLVEELFFRGMLQRALRRRFGPVPAVAVSSALFGLAHFELVQLPALVLFGVVLGVMAERAGRLGPGIVAHGAFNAATVLWLVLRR